MPNALEKQIADQIAAQTAEIRVPANALVLVPCLTKEMLLRQPRAPGVTDAQLLAAYEMMSFDDLGCRIDPLTGFRIPENCRPASQGEKRGLCPGVPREVQSDTSQRLAAFVEHAVPVISSVLPVLGPGLSQAIAPVIAEVTERLGLTGSSFISDEIKLIAAAFSSAVEDTFKTSAATVINAAKDTFKTLGVSAKTLADLVNPALNGGVEAAQLLAYANAREGLSVARNMLANHAPTIDLVRGLAVDSASSVVDYATAKLRRDALKSLGGLSNAVGVVLDARGAVSADVLDNLLATMPDTKTLSASGLGAIGLRGVSLDLAADAAGKFARDPAAMVNAFDPVSFSRLIPDPAMRLDFANRALDARALDHQIEPFVKRAEQQLGARFDAVRATLAVAKTHPLVADVQKRMQNAAAIRAEVKSALDEADRTVKQGLALYDPREIGR